MAVVMPFLKKLPYKNQLRLPPPLMKNHRPLPQPLPQILRPHPLHPHRQHTLLSDPHISALFQRRRQIPPHAFPARPDASRRLLTHPRQQRIQPRIRLPDIQPYRRLPEHG